MQKNSYCGDCSAEEFQQFEPSFRQLITLANTEILPRFLCGVAVLEKSDHTPVTAADRGAEKVMREWIEQNYPHHGIYGEEFGIKEPTGEYPHYRWILDPIDGTKNFITNAFQFGTLIALEKDDGKGFKPLMGVISHPQVGAWLIGDGKKTILHLSDNQEIPCEVRNTTELNQATLLTSSHWTTPEQHGGKEMQDLIDSVKLYRTWGDCFGYFAVATGGADIMIDTELNYWDVAAVVPVIKGAKGVIVSKTGGNPLKELSAVAACPALIDKSKRDVICFLLLLDGKQIFFYYS